MDDTAVVRSVAEDMLASVGCSVTTANSGEEAIRVLELERDDSFDLILMDCQMPGLNGMEASRRIVERWPEFAEKIVAMSAHTPLGGREELRAVGMVDILGKPFRLTELEALLNRF